MYTFIYLYTFEMFVATLQHSLEVRYDDFYWVSYHSVHTHECAILRLIQNFS